MVTVVSKSFKGTLSHRVGYHSGMLELHESNQLFSRVPDATVCLDNLLRAWSEHPICSSLPSSNCAISRPHRTS